MKLLPKIGKKNSYMDWGQHITMNYAQKRKCPNNAKQTTFRIFQNSERNLVMHFHKTVYRYISSFHWASGTKKRGYQISCLWQAILCCGGTESC